MSRSSRMREAEETVRIVDRGIYTSARGRAIDFAETVRGCVDATRFFPPEELEQIREDVLARPSGGVATILEVVNETTLAGIARVLSAEHGPVAALNFASAKNPGGGFLSGSQAQEESLARSSALHASLLRAPEYYERHRASPSLLYSDAAILSPQCPIIRNDDGALLDEPMVATLITCASPNTGALADNRSHELSLVPAVFRRRAEYVLALASSEGYKQLVLGAWGCGVFRNDPRMVARIFREHLEGAWSGRFERVVFSVLDQGPSQETFGAFRAAMGQ